MGVVVEVKANENSTTGGVGREVGEITFKAGDLVSIFCDFNNRWNLLDQQEDFIVNALGNRNHPITLSNGQRFAGGAMVGSFDNGNSFFSVGLFTQITISEAIPNPILRLYCADSDFQNNSGSIFAHVKVTGNRLVPNGSYLRSSKNVKITIDADCDTGDGTFQASSVEYTLEEAESTLRDIINIHGTLTKGF